MRPSYLKLHADGGLLKLARQSKDLLKSCAICPRKCGINRLKGERGFCKTAGIARVYNYMPHFGEEPAISGQRGSGTIFFCGCNMACVYCQNYKFSQLDINKNTAPPVIGTKKNPQIKLGKIVTEQELAQFMIELQKQGCNNINLVTPTHVMPQIINALLIAADQGLRLPLVYNTSGYELPEVIRLLKDIVDIFLVDMRYGGDEASLKYSNAPDYPRYNQAAIISMHQQVGVAQINKQGLITKGLIIRHLILPHNLAQTDKILRFIAREISCETYISLMSQYLPCYKADKFPELSRRISHKEYVQAQQVMSQLGLLNGWLQDSRGLVRFAGTNICPMNKVDKTKTGQ
ncbi:MAG: radical SAM protein [Candidatus Omnitrophota bacterium]